MTFLLILVFANATCKRKSCLDSIESSKGSHSKVELNARIIVSLECFRFCKSLIFLFRLAIGFPNCKNRQQWLVYHYRGSGDRLVLYPSGKLRHYVLKHQNGNEEQQQQQQDFIVDHERSFDYEQGYYCLDKVILQLIQTY